MSNSFFNEKFERDLFESFENDPSFAKPKPKIQKQQKSKQKYKPKLDLSFMNETKNQIPENSQELGYEITSSGAFECEDIKISRNGISVVPSTLDSQDTQFYSTPPSFNETSSRSPAKKKNITTKEKPLTKRQSSIKFEDLKRIKHLGEGASSSVDLVEDTNGKKYALKMINISKSKIKVMYSEIKSLHKCRKCPNVIQMYEAYYRDSKMHILLEFMDMDIETLFKRAKTIPEDILALILIQILNALKYLHERKKIIHRDLKPANILISKNGIVKVSDFGLTGIKSGMQNEQVFKTCQGTIYYMSPERIQDQPHSFASDIWSIGISCIELFMGKIPFSNSTYFDVLSEIAEFETLNLPNTMSNDLKDFIKSCLMVNPEKRKTASQLLNSNLIKNSKKDINYLAEFVSKYINE